MADSWRALSSQTAYASNKAMLDVFNATGSGRVLRIRRVYHFNSFSLAAITGIATTMTLRRTTTGSSGGTAITPVPNSLGNTPLPAQVTAGTGRTTTDSDLFRQYVVSGDEPQHIISTWDEYLTVLPWSEVWNAGYGDSNIQPVVCRENQGFVIRQPGVNAIGVADLEIEFDNEAT